MIVNFTEVSSLISFKTTVSVLRESTLPFSIMPCRLQKSQTKVKKINNELGANICLGNLKTKRILKAL